MAKTVSSPFRVQVKAPTPNRAIAALASIDDLAFEGRIVLPRWTDPQTGAVGGVYFGKHANWQFCSADNKFYSFGGDGGYPGARLDSGANRHPRITLNAQATGGSYDNFYPHYGVAGKEFPLVADDVPWMWDAGRGCFWSVGGFFWGPGGPSYDDPRNVGIKVRGGPDVWRFWVTGPQAGNWERVARNVPYVHGEGMSGIYHPPSDCLIWLGPLGVGAHRLGWYNCTTGTSGFTAYFTPGLPNVRPGTEPSLPEQPPNVWDSVKNELIWVDFGGYNGVYAISLANFPTSARNRQLWRGFNGTPGLGQTPLFIRGRKLYLFAQPYNSAFNSQSETPFGIGTGLYELELDTGVMRQGSQPWFELRETANSYLYGARYVNEGAYSPIADSFMSTQSAVGVVGGSPLIFKFSPPSWTPAAGNVKAIATDVSGAPTNSLYDVRPYAPANDHGSLPYGGFAGAGVIVSAWAGGCYARDISTNGALLIQNGGDGDYWGNEVYAFDFDTRRWHRLSDPSTAMSRNPAADEARAPTDPLYFNRDECEHGPAVAEYGWGLLPAGTQPGVPHTYDGLEYVPASFIGNMRGALVRPISTFVYVTRGTTRAHYFDLDPWQRKWGRLSSNKLVVSSTGLPVTALDESLGRVYHNRGYLDLNAKQQVAVDWGGLPEGASSCFDPVRRIWVVVVGGNPGSAAQLWCRRVDSGEASFSPSFSGDAPWDGGQGHYGGIEYCPTLDCFFFYNVGGHGRLPAFTPQVIWKITAPTTNFKTTAWQVQRITMGGDAVVGVAPDTVRGTFSRLRWVPPLKCLTFYHGGRVYLYKPQGL